MTYPIKYMLYKDSETHTVTISPVNQSVDGGDMYVTGVFRLNEGDVDLGDIVFDDHMNQWEYTGMGDLTHNEAAEIATYIKDQEQPAPNSAAQ